MVRSSIARNRASNSNGGADRCAENAIAAAAQDTRGSQSSQLHPRFDTASSANATEASAKGAPVYGTSAFAIAGEAVAYGAARQSTATAA